MDKIAGKINLTRLNWWSAFKSGISVKGFDYYKVPPELKYRYPAPGSSPLDEVDHPHLYKKHWKTPYRESPLNIQKKERIITDAENVEVYAPKAPEFDPNDYYDQLILREQQPLLEGKKPLFDQEEMTLEERKDEIWKTLELQPKIMNTVSMEYAPYHWDLDQDYFPRQQIFRERGATGVENDPIYREIFVELEYMIENVIGYNRIQTKKMDMLKGTPKKWQILDDKTFDRDQIEKIQAAVRAPLPDELEMYEAKHNKPMQLPINNTNVSLWRDDQRAIDTADFDPKFLEYDRERRKKYFLERYEKPKELTE